MSTIKIPAAIVYCFSEPKTLDGPIPLFSRVSIPMSTYPSHLTQTLANTPTIGPNGYSDDWVVLSIKVSITRFWACSTAIVTLTRPLYQGDTLLAPPIHPEMPIAIAMGYDSTLYGLPTSELTRVFTGYADTVTIKLTPKRVIAQFAVRDVMRFLVDNKMTKIYDSTNSKTPDISFYNPDTKQFENAVGQQLAIQGARHNIVAQLIVDGSGKFDDGITPAITPAQISGNISISKRLPIKPNEDGNGVDAAGTTQSKIMQLYNVMNRYPIEIIKHLSSVETEPKELFADQWGNVHWRTRDTANVDKPRDYWFRNKVDLGATPTSGVSPILTGSMEWSTIGTMTEFVVVNADANSAGDNAGSLGFRARLNTKAALGFDMASRTRFVFDDTLQNGEGELGTKGFLNAMLMIWGKDVRAGSIEIEGDATILPGEAIRIWNMGIYHAPNNLFRTEAVVHSFTGSGPKKGFRTSIMFSTPTESLEKYYKEGDPQKFKVDQKTIRSLAERNGG